MQLQTRTSVQTLNAAHRTPAGREEVYAAQPQQGKCHRAVTEVICDQQHQDFTLNATAWMAGSCLSQKWLAQLQGLCLS